MRVLVVEDERRLAAAVRRGLSAEGFAVDLAHNGEDGLHAAREGGYDAVVLDLMLPKISGYKICQQLRAEENWVPILILSAKDGEYDQAAPDGRGQPPFVLHDEHPHPPEITARDRRPEPRAAHRAWPPGYVVPSRVRRTIRPLLPYLESGLGQAHSASPLARAWPPGARRPAWDTLTGRAQAAWGKMANDRDPASRPSRRDGPIRGQIRAAPPGSGQRRPTPGR